MAALKSIQVDMFSVGLGAAILVQVRGQDGGVIRILADGGMGHGRYVAEGVRDRLPDAMNAFGAAPHDRIDLIVGTHYDGDHLKGLVPIAKSSTGIGEVWLPPVKDDSGDVDGLSSGNSQFLAERLYEDDDGAAFRRFVRAKAADIQETIQQGQRTRRMLLERGQKEALPTFREFLDRSSGPSATLEDSAYFGDPARIEKFFSEHERHAANLLESDSDHESAEYDSRAPDLQAVALALHESLPGFAWRSRENSYTDPDAPAVIATAVPRILASIRKSTATSAITAIHLDALVQALKSRPSPIRPVCKYINAGKPRRFLWESAQRRFVAGVPGAKSHLMLDLMGPSDSLVNKHRDKLPLGVYLEALNLNRGLIDKKPITASNQLSYVLALEAFGQRVLITGDAGCYDFRDTRGNLHQPLARLLAPLHVVQIAHHAGNNYDFYNALCDSRFAAHGGRTHLLLSHAVHDKTRPSPAFGQFVAHTLKDGGDLCLLTTSEPDALKVAAFRSLFAAVTPSGPNKPDGDARLHYAHDERGGRWNVDKHAVVA